MVDSKEEKNYWQIVSLLYKVAPSAVRVKFDKEFHPTKGLELALSENKWKVVDKLKKKKTINQVQWDLMYPTSGVVSSKTFDLTLMICLLRNLARIPVGDILPHFSVISEAADLSRLKYYRNKFAHIDGCAITYNDFHIYWSDISQAIIRLGGPQFTQICQEVKDVTLNNNDKELLKEIRNLEKTLDFVPKALQKIHEDLIRKWDDEDKKVIKTRAMSQIEKLLKSTDVIVAVGPSGCGKSTAIHHVALWLHNQEGYTIVPVHSPDEIISYCNPTYKQVFVIDDVCGKSTINIGLVNCWNTWAPDIKQVIEDHKIKILLSCRKHIYLDRSFKGVELLSETACDLGSSYSLTTIERNQIANIYLGVDEVFALNMYGLVDKFSFFPLLCSLYSKQKVTNFHNFFAYPISVIRSDLDLLRKATDQTTLATMSLLIAFDNNLDENLLTRSHDMTELLEAISDHFYLQARFSIKVVKSELQKLEMSYLKKTVSTYRILHDRIYDILLSFYGEHFFDLVLEVAHRDVIQDRLVLESVQKENQHLVNKENIITVPDKEEDHYFQRILKDIKKVSIVHIFDNRQLECITFRKKLFQYLEQKVDIKEMLSALSIRDISYILLSITSKFYWDLVPILLTEHVDVNIVGNEGTPLYLASEKGHTDIVRLLLKHNCNPDICTKNKESPVLIASIKGYFDIVRLLLENKCDPNICNHLNASPLYAATVHEHADIVRLLLEYKCDPNICYGCKHQNISPLFAASQNGNVDIVRLLLENNSDHHVCNGSKETPLFIASANGYTDIVKLLLEHNCDPNVCNNHNISPLSVATANRHADIVRLLLEYKCDPNICYCNNRSPLFVASACKFSYDIVKLLLEYKADPNICDCQNISPLFVATENRHADIVRLLLEHNSDPHICNNEQESPLFIASKEGYHDIVRLLLKHKCDPHVSYKNPYSPLWVASSEGHTNIVKLLLQHKSDPNLCGPSNISPLFAASSSGHTDIVRVLLEYNSDPNKFDSDNISPLFVASMNGFTDIVRLLLDRNCDPRKSLVGDISPSCIASTNGHTDVVGLLIEHKYLS